MNVAADDFCQKGMSGARAACEEYAAPCMSDSGASVRGIAGVLCKGYCSENEHVSCLKLCPMKMCMQGLEFTARVYFICGRVGWGS